MKNFLIGATTVMIFVILILLLLPKSASPLGYSGAVSNEWSTGGTWASTTCMAYADLRVERHGTTVLSADGHRQYAYFENAGGGDAYLFLSNTTTSGMGVWEGIRLASSTANAGFRKHYEIDQDNLYTGQIRCVGYVASSTIFYYYK